MLTIGAELAQLYTIIPSLVIVYDYNRRVTMLISGEYTISEGMSAEQVIHNTWNHFFTREDQNDTHWN